MSHSIASLVPLHSSNLVQSKMYSLHQGLYQLIKKFKQFFDSETTPRFSTSFQSI